MGSDAWVYPFDYELYRRRIVPAIKSFLLSGQAEHWLHELIEGTKVELAEIKRTDLDRYCTYLDSDLAWNSTYEFTSTWFDNWSERACKSEICPERARCPYHQVERASAITEELNILIEDAVFAFCIAEEQFVGRTMTVKRYEDLLASFNISSTDPLFSLLLKLGKRGYVIGYKWASYAEGIHGWLNPEETRELADRLVKLPLPQYPATFESMDQIHKSFSPYNRPDPPEYSFTEASLSFVRTVAVIATERKKGMLWANDPIQYPDYSGYSPKNISLDS